MRWPVDTVQHSNNVVVKAYVKQRTQAGACVRGRAEGSALLYPAVRWVCGRVGGGERGGEMAGGTHGGDMPAHMRVVLVYACACASTGPCASHAKELRACQWCARARLLAASAAGAIHRSRWRHTSAISWQQRRHPSRSQSLTLPSLAAPLARPSTLYALPNMFTACSQACHDGRMGVILAPCRVRRGLVRASTGQPSSGCERLRSAQPRHSMRNDALHSGMKAPLPQHCGYYP
jgi:hypothetical protein